jgi:hypothetical protein
MNNELKIGLNCVLSCTNYIKSRICKYRKQITDAIVGMKIVVIKNSFIVLPLDILAIKPQ